MKRILSILIVDDTEEDRETYKAFLGMNQDYEFTILEASTADEGLRTCRGVKLDCVFLDFNLPDVDGLEFIERWESDEEHTDLPIVMITGRGSEGIAVAALKKGASDYLVKSEITAESLFRAFDNAVQKSELRRRLAVETTEKESAQDELRQSEEQFRLLIEGLKDYAVIMLDTEGKVQTWNSGARSVFDMHDTEIQGQHFRTLYKIDDIRVKAPEQDLSIANNKGGRQVERQFRRSDSDLFWGFLTINPLFDAGAVLRGYSFVVRDITERRHMLDQLSLEQNWMDSVLNNLPAAVVLSEASSGEITYSNLAANLLFGVPFTRVVRAGTTANEGLFTDLDGKILNYDSLPWMNSETKSDVATNFNWQIGNRKIGISAVTHLFPPLFERPATLITVMNNRAQLDTTEASLTEVKQGWNAFTGILAHELRTPVTAMAFHIESSLAKLAGATESSALLEKARHALQASESQLSRLNQLIENLIVSSDTSLENSELILTEFDLGTFVSEYLATTESVTGASGNTVSFSSTEPVLGRWDRLRVAQILKNLLSNSVKFAQGTKIEIRVWKTESTAWIEYSDAGAGIDLDANQTFRRFGRTDTSASLSGIGLGLFSVQQNVRAHGGSIKIERQPASGTRFIMSLPIGADISE